MSKAPAFQFYTGDWLSSTAITLMTPAEEGAYIRLLAYMWNDPDCGLPDDPEKLTALSRLTLADRGVIGSILACFEKHPSKKGFLTNKRLSDEKKKQEEWRQHQREAGIKGMESRWSAKKKKHNKPITSLLQKHNPSSSSSSSSSSSIKKEDKILSSRTSLDTFLNSLKENPAYKGIDIDREIHKMNAWFLTPKGAGRKLTHKFILNWLNKCEKDLSRGVPLSQRGTSKTAGNWTRLEERERARQEALKNEPKKLTGGENERHGAF